MIIHVVFKQSNIFTLITRLVLVYHCITKQSYKCQIINCHVDNFAL